MTKRAHHRSSKLIYQVYLFIFFYFFTNYFNTDAEFRRNHFNISHSVFKCSLSVILGIPRNRHECKQKKKKMAENSDTPFVTLDAPGCEFCRNACFGKLVRSPFKKKKKLDWMVYYQTSKSKFCFFFFLIQRRETERIFVTNYWHSYWSWIPFSTFWLVDLNFSTNFHPWTRIKFDRFEDYEVKKIEKLKLWRTDIIRGAFFPPFLVPLLKIHSSGFRNG